MRAFSSNLAQIVTAVALLYFFRGVLAPFFLALVIMVVIHAIADVTVGLLPKAPRWIVMVLTAVVLGALIIAASTLRFMARRISFRRRSRRPCVCKNCCKLRVQPSVSRKSLI